jgi:hypothetical protein
MEPTEDYEEMIRKYSESTECLWDKVKANIAGWSRSLAADLKICGFEEAGGNLYLIDPPVSKAREIEKNLSAIELVVQEYAGEQATVAVATIEDDRGA